MTAQPVAEIGPGADCPLYEAKGQRRHPFGKTRRRLSLTLRTFSTSKRFLESCRSLTHAEIAEFSVFGLALTADL